MSVAPKCYAKTGSIIIYINQPNLNYNYYKYDSHNNGVIKQKKKGQFCKCMGCICTPLYPANDATVIIPIFKH